jgi:LmbE family N-acetylglucosaminyl deacetylase
MGLNVLCIAAHADDETLGCGGTLARLADEGAHVSVLIMTKASPAFAERYGTNDADAIDHERKREAHNACDVLGVRDLYFGPFFELAAPMIAATADFIADMIRRTSPTIVFTHHWADLHQDHRAIAEASLIATRPYRAVSTLRHVLAYAVDPMHWQDVPRSAVFFDITRTLHRKCRALEQYTTEIMTFPHPRSIKALTSRAQFIGSQCGSAAAESFEVLWEKR